MAKQLTQIAFDFGPPAEPEQKTEPLAAEPVKDLVLAEREPALVEPEEEEVVMITETEEELYVSAPVSVAPPKRTSTRGRRSLQENSRKADLIEIPADEELFKKSYYPIGEVAKMFGENQSLIRYWESEFDILKPRKNKKGDRYFRPVDIKNLVLIHDLLRRRKFTIEGAKEYLRKSKKVEEKFALIQSLEKMKSFFLELKAAL
ncbi:MAG: MerR family transcriptional regulator [Chitinophagaceae bacterium]|nr:MerR family transcriptional regulator [Chitinophagaceae bacterium]